VLEQVDAILAGIGGKRSPQEQHWCLARAPFEDQRNALCEHTELEGAWTLWGPHPGSPNGVKVELSQHRFLDGERALALDRALAQLGAGAGGHDGGISWCHTQASWTETALWGLDRSCGVSHKVLWVQEILALLRESASPYDEIVAVKGTPGGWAHLVDTQDQERTLTIEQRRRIFVQVKEVAHDDVLWVRSQRHETGQRYTEPLANTPPTSMPQKIGSLAHNARCVPLLMRPPDTDWVMVESPQGIGWANSRYLAPQATSACSAP
jgi:hypothetical protein